MAVLSMYVYNSFQRGKIMTNDAPGIPRAIHTAFSISRRYHICMADSWSVPYFAGASPVVRNEHSSKETL
jgi:hypothetical protein